MSRHTKSDRGHQQHKTKTKRRSARALPLWARPDCQRETLRRLDECSGTIAYDVRIMPPQAGEGFTLASIYAQPFRTDADAANLADIICANPADLSDPDVRTQEGIIDRTSAFDPESGLPEGEAARCLPVVSEDRRRASDPAPYVPAPPVVVGPLTARAFSALRRTNALIIDVEALMREATGFLSENILRDVRGEFLDAAKSGAAYMVHVLAECDEHEQRKGVTRG